MRFVFEVDCVAISLLQNPRMEIVFVLNMKVPAPHVRRGQIVSAHFCCFYVPDQTIFQAISTIVLWATISVLVTHSDSGCGHSINSLENETKYSIRVLSGLYSEIYNLIFSNTAVPCTCDISLYAAAKPFQIGPKTFVVRFLLKLFG